MGPFKKIVNIRGKDYLAIIEFQKTLFVYKYFIEFYSRSKYDPVDFFNDYESKYAFYSFEKPVDAIKKAARLFEQKLIAEENARKRKKDFETVLEEWDGRC